MGKVFLMNTQPSSTAAAPAPPPMAQMMQLMFGKHVTYSLSAIARLGVADHLGRGPAAVDELARKVGAHAPFLYRVMRMLASLGVFEEAAGKRFSLTPVGELLKTDAPQSIRYMAMMWGDEWSTRAFEHFADCVRTGENGVIKAYGRDAFDVFAERRDQADTFHRAMTQFSVAEAEAIVEAYDFSGIGCMADVGGGRGMLLASILKHYPRMRGVLCDLPEVAGGASEEDHFADLRDRIDVQPSSFFECVPPGCDAYILKHIIHDWSDDHCRKILSLIREQLPQNGRVLLCEWVIPDDPKPDVAKMLDIEMLVLTPGGRERTAGEFRDLLDSAGLRLERIVPTKGPVCIVEARHS